MDAVAGEFLLWTGMAKLRDSGFCKTRPPVKPTVVGQIYAGTWMCSESNTICSPFLL